jgi:hypothetical protein
MFAEKIPMLFSFPKLMKTKNRLRDSEKSHTQLRENVVVSVPTAQVLIVSHQFQRPLGHELGFLSCTF